MGVRCGTPLARNYSGYLDRLAHRLYLGPGGASYRGLSRDPIDQRRASREEPGMSGTIQTGVLKLPMKDTTIRDEHEPWRASQLEGEGLHW